jgi:UDP-3-O-[3-hydroxymyristoyl] N-acetylglucosamine deacetylase
LISYKLNREISLTGVGVHSGAPSTVVVKRNDALGIRFVRDDISENNIIQAAIENVVDTRSCTVLANEHGVTVATIEHLMAALCAYQITDVDIHLSQMEMPILDGCSKAFVDAIDEVGVVEAKKVDPIVISKPIEIREENRWIRVEPSDNDLLSFELTQDYQGREGLGEFSISYGHTRDAFKNQIARARTFGFFADAEKLYAMGLAKGSSLENSLVIKDGKPMNDGGARFENEMVRHKVLDALGDFYLAGRPLIAKVTGLNIGHELNNKIMRKLQEGSTKSHENAIVG